MFTIALLKRRDHRSHIMWRDTLITLCGKKLIVRRVKDFIQGNVENCNCAVCIKSLNKRIEQRKII